MVAPVGFAKNLSIHVEVDELVQVVVHCGPFSHVLYPPFFWEIYCPSPFVLACPSLVALDSCVVWMTGLLHLLLGVVSLNGFCFFSFWASLSFPGSLLSFPLQFRAGALSPQLWALGALPPHPFLVLGQEEVVGELWESIPLGQALPPWPEVGAALGQAQPLFGRPAQDPPLDARVQVGAIPGPVLPDSGRPRLAAPLQRVGASLLHNQRRLAAHSPLGSPERSLGVSSTRGTRTSANAPTFS